MLIWQILQQNGMFGASVKFNEITLNFITLKQKHILQYLNSVCFNKLKHAINYFTYFNDQ